MKNISRRNFLKIAFVGTVLTAFQGFFLRKAAAAKEEWSSGRPKSGIKGNHDIVLAEGKDPYDNTVKAIEAMGGMGKFVKKGAVVVIKPNIAWDRTPEQAATTDPNVVAALVDLCYKAGAKRVNVFDRTCNDARRCYLSSEIQKIARDKGAHVYFPDDWNTVKAKFTYASPMDGWPILRDGIQCDTFINVPVLKHHALTGLTLSMKNLMGVCSGTRSLMHVDIGRKLVDLTGFINPDLTVMDAHRVLIKNGPTGGNPDDVITMNRLIVATDPTLVDGYAAKMVDVDPLSVPYIKNAVERGIGNIDFEKADILELKKT